MVGFCAHTETSIFVGKGEFLEGVAVRRTDGVVLDKLINITP